MNNFLNNFLTKFLTITRGKAEIPQTREIGYSFMATKKSAFADFGDSTNVESNLDCHLDSNIQQQRNFVNTQNKDVEVAGFAPAEPWVTIQVPHSGTPTSLTVYQKEIMKTTKKAGGCLKTGLSPANRHSAPANKKR